MKPFNLQEALAGKPVVTRSGAPVIQITKFKARNEMDIAGVVDGNIKTFRSNGTFSYYGESGLDLFMASEKKEGWVNVYNSRNSGWRNAQPNSPDRFGYIYDSKKMAEEYAGGGLIATVRIEWEE